ncbi:glycerophosphodiester phosphodiesterase [Streptomyces sp. NPDC051561]|uniref:glycerophosphodiester phosphodiesterase n=1 Tax=Streptomyces sp. NPDC051561 TaxID=3365658 RepID=UPI00378A28C4
MPTTTLRRAAATSLTALLGGAAALALPATAQAAPAPAAPRAAAAPAPAAGGPTIIRRPVVIAHRGAAGQAPENTLAAVDRADALGFDWVENDVQRTKDGELVIVHDDSLARTTNVEELFPDRAPWKIKDFTAAEIRTLDAGSWFGPAFAGARVPTLKEYVNRVDRNHQKMLMEVKNPELYPGIEKNIADVLDQEGWLDRSHVLYKLVMQSFSADSVRTFHGLRPEVTTGFLGTPALADLPQYAAFTDQINPQHGTINAAFVKAVHSLRGPQGKVLQVNTWTVDDAVNTKKVWDYKVDGIISNKPDVVREAMRQP